MEVDTCVGCNICKVAYSTEQELEEHNWSLMHHIKIEQTKKGAPHSCSLCMETSANIIEYGKHLNEDKHKIALSRLSQGGSDQMLNSIPQTSPAVISQKGVKSSSQSVDMLPSSQPVPLLTPELQLMYQNRKNFKHPGKKTKTSKKSKKAQKGWGTGAWQTWDEQGDSEMGSDVQLRKSNRGLGNNHASGPWQTWDELGDSEIQNNHWSSMQQYGQGPRQTPDQGYYNYHNAQENVYSDNYGDDWNDGQFSSKNIARADQYFKKNRRGSFDESYMSRKQNKVDRRGRGILRGRGHTRTNSYDPHNNYSTYDNCSPESNSSSDSNGLKRRLEDNELGAPEKSRRKNDGYMGRSMYHWNKDQNTQSDLTHDKLNLRGRTERRSTSSEKQLPNERSRSTSLNSTNRRVTWSDQQDVTSTSDIHAKTSSDTDRGSSLGTGIRQAVPIAAVPDSSTEIRKPKKKEKGKASGKKSLTKSVGKSKITDDNAVKKDKKSGGKDSTESVLEKAENLCKKLRNEREKIKQQKLSQAKQKKIERTEELNTQIAELSKENMKKITGRLETLENVTLKETEKFFDSQGPKTVSSIKTGVDTSNLSNSILPTQNRESPVSSLRAPNSKSAISPTTSGDPNMAERIAQTRADIDAIRAKIEGSVQAEKTRPGFKSPPIHLSSPSPNSKPDNQSLLKMVNAPRTTRERLHVAQLLRNHAKSQSRFSLPRFNLKMSDLVENQPELEDLSEFSIEALAPSVQLEIANLIEADIKPDVAELQLLLDAASSQNAELDFNILSDLGISQSPSRIEKSNQKDMTKVGLTERQNSPLHDFENKQNGTSKDINSLPERSRSPIASRKSPERHVEHMDDQPSLSVEELVTEVNKAKEHLLGVRERNRQDDLHRKQENMHTSPFSSSLPLSGDKNKSGERLASSVRETSNRLDPVRIKTEKEDDGYNFALSSSTGNQLKSREREPALNKDSGMVEGSNAETSKSTVDKDMYQSGSNTDFSALQIGKSDFSTSSKTIKPSSSIHRSVHTRQFYPSSDEMPVRDTDKPTSSLHQNSADSTVERVNAILNAVPNMDKVLTHGETTASQVVGDRPTSPLHEVSRPMSPKSESLRLNLPDDKDKQFNSSVNSNMSSVLDQVYSICVEEESIRSEINTVDAKIDKLKSLISEAQMQLNTFTERRRELTTKESHFRSSRMRLLHESRSQQGSSGSQSEGLPCHKSDLADTHPLMAKFLMSQRQSDLSSVGGFSNVESGSQPDDGQHSQRRGSMDSVKSGQGVPALNLPGSRQRNQNLLFSQSIDILTGSTDTLTSLKSQGFSGNQDRDSGTPIPVDVNKNNEQTSGNGNPESNSISLLKQPLDNFVTLDALLKGDTEIGKLIHKSLESIQKGEVRQQEEVVIKSPDSVCGGSKGIVGSLRNRRDSALSAGSEDMCVSGSDTEKLMGKVSMKYMGTLPEGVNYDSIVKQISSGGKNKPVMFTLLSSPEPMVTGKTDLKNKVNESPLAKANTIEKSKNAFVADFSLMYDKSPRSDTTSTLDLNEAESLSARSNFSLGEKIKQMCDGQNPDTTKNSNLLSPQSESSGEKTLEDESNKTLNKDILPKNSINDLPMSSPKTVIEKMVTPDSSSPSRKKLKSKRERDQKSRRKQKENFILCSDTNSEVEEGSQSSSLLKSSKSTSKSEEDLVLTGSEDSRTPRHQSGLVPNLKKSLLDEVQLETETLSESGEDKSKQKTKEEFKRLTIQPERLEKFRNSVKKLNPSADPTPIEYQGPPLSVMAIQIFKGDVYVCYNGSIVRRFQIKTGKLIKELDTSPYLISCMHVTSVEDRGDILYAAGPCKKLLLFNPLSFSSIGVLTYVNRIVCLHENWGRLFVGFDDGTVTVLSLKTDKALNTFSCSACSINCIASASAGMTKMLCLGMEDKIIYILDAITGLLITMLEGHTLPPLCIQVVGETVVSSSPDHTILIHNVMSGALLKTVSTNKPLSQIWTDGTNMYAASHDKMIWVYNQDFKLTKLHKTQSIASLGIEKDGQMYIGYRNGMVEAIPVTSLGIKTSDKGTKKN